MTETPTDLELALPPKENLTPEETLIAKVTLSLKAIHGLAGRLEGMSGHLVQEEDVDKYDAVSSKMASYSKSLGDTARYIQEALEKYMLQRGVSLDRYNQIADYVYTHEKKM